MLRAKNADTYAVQLPEHFQQLARELTWRKGKIHAVRPVFRVLGDVSALAYEAIERGYRSPTTADLTRTTGISRRALTDHLAGMEALGRAETGRRSFSARSVEWVSAVSVGPYPMSTFSRVLPGLAALALSFLSGYVWVFAGPYRPSLFTVAHVGSAVICAAVPFAFHTIGRAAGCRTDLLKLGAILLALAATPMLVANGIYLFSFRSVEGSYGDIGGIGLALLGLAALLITSLACSIGLPVARPGVTTRSEVSAPPHS